MTNRKLQKPIRKFISSRVKRKVPHHEQSKGHDHSGLCKKSHTQQEGKKYQFLFHKNISKTGLYNRNSRRHRKSRIFKHVRKKKRSDVQITGEDSDDCCYISGKETNLSESVASGKLTYRKNNNMEAKSPKQSSRTKKTFSALKRAVSLRLKSRKDSESEKVDLSSLVRLVELENSGTKLTSSHATEVSECIGTSGMKTLLSNNNNNQKLERTRNVKENDNESNILSPTCGDMYGTDEEESLNCSFQNNAITERIMKVNNDKLVSDDYGSVSHIKTTNIHECISDNSTEQCEVYSNLTFHLTEDSKPYDRENSVLASHSSLDISDDTKKISTAEIPLFKNRLGNSSCDIVIEDFENPWVLQSKFQQHDKNIEDFKRSLSNDGSVVYESLGFSVTNLDLENSLLSPKSARRKNIKTLKRSKSIESLDSFNSSIHSLNSEECFFSSDSEADVQADEISLSSSNSFVSAKDYNEQNDLGDGLIEKLRKSSSLDSLNKALSADNAKVKPAESFDALDTTPVAKSMKHTYSVDDVHRIIQRPSSLSFVKGFSLDSASKSDKTPKSEKKKVKNKRRSLDSSFKTAEIKSDFKAELERQNLKSASSDSGLSSVLSPVQENGTVKLRSNSNMDAPGDKMYHTLPNPRKIKSFPPLLPKKKVTRIGSLSKMFSEKAESFTGLKLGSSFKLRNLEKPITSGLNKTRSLTTLMSKKGSAMVSSISSYIKGKSTSETNLDMDMVDSPFKPKARKATKMENDDSVFVYEKVRVLVPRKRQANKQEQAAQRKRLTLDLKLSSIKQIGLDSASANDKKNLSGSKLVSPSSSSSVNSMTCPTMLDELMKSVDTRRFSLGLALDMENMSDTEQDETSSKSSSLGLLSKKQSIVSDITTPGSVFTSGGDYFLMCERCRKMRFCLDRSLELDVMNPVEKKCQSLYNLNSFCACSGVGNSCDTSPSVGRRGLHSHVNNKDMEDDSFSASSPILKRQTSISLQELRHSKSLPFQSYVCDDTLHDSNFDSVLKETPNVKARRSLPYSLAKYEPCLDLSADDIDEIGSIDNGSDGKIYERNVEKSHSCSDLLDKSDDISFITEPGMYSSKPLERKPSKRGDRPVKVKSLSSSHDALTCLTAVDIPDIAVSVESIEDGHELVKPEVTITKDLEDSSDSGNEDYHSVGSETEKTDCTSCNLNRTEQHSVITSELLHVSGLNMPDYSPLPNAFQNIDMVCEMCKAKTKNPSCASTSGDFEICKDNGKYDLNDNDKPAFEDTQNHELVSEQVKCFECYEVGNKKFIESNKPKHRPLTIRRKFLSVSDIDMRDCDKIKLNGLKQKSLSNSKLHELEEGKCSNCGCSETVTQAKLPFQSEKVKTITNSGSVAGVDSEVLHTNINASNVKDKFLFDDQMVKTYKNTQNIRSISRMKSVSSDDVHAQPYLDTKICFTTPSLSVDKLDQKKSQNFTHDKLCIDQEFFPSNLSPLYCVPGLPPFHGFSAFSPQPVDSQLPELEEVYKYDICLGYLVHSITCDNKTICVYSLQRNKQLMEGVITPISGLPGAPHTRPSESSHGKSQKTQQKVKNEDLPNPAAPITVVPSEKLSHAGHVLRTVLLSRASHMIRDRKFHLRTYRRCMVGTEMVDWLLQQSSLVHSRTQAVGMWQALVEEGVIVHVCHEHQFKDKYLFYRFREDDQGVSTVPSNMSKKECEDELQEIFLMLAQIGPDAMMRMILRKLPHERTVEDLEIIYEELLHIKALSHLSTMVKRELASVLVFESHAKSGTVLFNQGDEGKSWYIILKGSVNVVIYGKGVVCTLHEGDDFGKLALVNDAPRAATIVLRDDNCHFLRVDKDDFNRILRDVEANTVRLKEHGQDVLVLEKIPTNTQSADGTVQAHYKYSIMAGTPEKMLEHLLETRLDNKGEEELGMYRDGFLEDFLLTHVIFMPCNHLCPVLLSHYHSSMSDSTEQENFEFMLNHKKCVLHFVQEWSSIVGNAFREDHTINAFLEELHSCVLEDQQSYISLREDADALENIIEAQGRLAENQLLTNSGTHPPLTRKTSKDNMNDNTKRKKVMKAADENIFKVYCADHTYCTLRLPMDTTVEQILSSARDKLCLGDDLVLCEVKSTGERITFKENDLCVTSGLSINGRLFITPREHQDALTPLPEQDGPAQSSVNTIELVSSREMAYYMTLFDWDLFSCVQEYELIYQVFGRYKFRKITANLDLFLRRFNEIQFWVVTEMVLTTNLSKRVALLRKFIKLASYCKDFQNLNSFFAIVMGLSNIAVSRLSQTWEKLPGKFKKMFADFETLMDPSRNHRVYRLSVAKMVPPIIPFMPLLMKDMRFTHDGNKTYFDGLVNFEKMHMIAQTLKTVRFCRSSPLELEPPSSMKSADISQYIRNLQVIDNQKHLDQISHKLEPRKT